MSLKWRFELLSWIFAFIVLLMTLLPFQFHRIPHPFLVYNCAFVLVFIHFTKYIFLLKHTPLSHAFILKLLLIFTALPTIVLLIDGLSIFQAYKDEIGLQELVQHLDLPNQRMQMKYIQVEMTFFGVGSIISSILLPIRMMVSIWRVKNLKNKV